MCVGGGLGGCFVCLFVLMFVCFNVCLFGHMVVHCACGGFR